MALPWGRPLVDDDLDALPDDGHRYELVEGVLLVTPAPGTDHQVCVVALVAILYAAAGPEVAVLTAPYDYRVSSTTVLQPDLLVARRSDLGPARLERAPLLVVEVTSRSTRLADLGTKRLAYAAAGVPTYWLVDPLVPSLTVLRLKGGLYVEEAVVGGHDAYTTADPLQVTVVPEGLLS